MEMTAREKQVLEDLERLMQSFFQLDAHEFVKGHHDFYHFRSHYEQMRCIILAHVAARTIAQNKVASNDKPQSDNQPNPGETQPRTVYRETTL